MMKKDVKKEPPKAKSIMQKNNMTTIYSVCPLAQDSMMAGLEPQGPSA